MAAVKDRRGEQPGNGRFNLRDVLARLPVAETNPATLEPHKRLAELQPPPIPVRSINHLALAQGPAKLQIILTPAAVAGHDRTAQWLDADLGWLFSPSVTGGVVGALLVVIVSLTAFYRSAALTEVSIQHVAERVTPPQVRLVATLVAAPERTAPGEPSAPASLQPAFAAAGSLADRFSEPPSAAAAAPLFNAPAAEQPKRSAAIASLEISSDSEASTGKNKSEDQARALFVQGEARLREGDVNGARMFFKKGAGAGDAQSAIAMGATYDPNLFSTLNVKGMRPDVDMARQWYERAIALGSKDARDRLDTLPAK